MPATPSPAPSWTTSERDAVRRTLAGIFTDDITTNDTGLVVVGADGSTLFSRRGRVPVAPASTLKLVVAATALDALGPKHRFETRFATSAPPESNGTVHGDLWLVGGGDPSLTSDDLRRGVGELVRGGVRQIDGTLQVDDTAFAGPEQNPRWDPDDLGYDYAAGTSAISLDEDTVEFDVTPDPSGGAARVRVVPDNQSIAFDGTIASGGYNTYVTIERKPETTLPSFSSERTQSGVADVPAVQRTEYVVDGRIAEGGMQTYYKPILGVPGYVGGAVAAMLASRRVALDGGYRTGPVPLGAFTLWRHLSAPLGSLVREMLVNSNNHTAETLLRVLGESSGHPGSDASGVAFEKRELARLDVAHERLQVYDGSGLAPSDRIMPETLAQLIARVSRGPYGDVFVRSLPRVGLEGTVRHHELRDALGRARAKSGHIEDVNGLAGTIVTRHHGRIAFAFIVNDPRANADVVYASEDRALDALSDF
ncbi:MAG: D-alanyl-D-alanine carboxypeptidase [Candidatus Eremiobacteraeota bacterium]|nr:D-alanyl-D-alanine carboxypeptidase [Candidatus Eremiobacteraeota bacterium]